MRGATGVAAPVVSQENADHQPNPAVGRSLCIRNATSITDYVFRWLGCQFIKGYKEATSPHRAHPDLPLKELA
jgi:hypothetical protein